jgi:hypothetical protein
MKKKRLKRQPAMIRKEVKEYGKKECLGKV